MSDVRDKLAPYLGKRMTVRGTLTKWDIHWWTEGVQTGRACVAKAEINGEVVCHHVWVVNAPHWQKVEGAIGAQVVFDAVVQRYVDRAGKTNYCLGDSSDPIVLNEPPALKIPEPPKEKKNLLAWLVLPTNGVA